MASGVVQIGDKTYPTIYDALADIPIGIETTMKLLDDIVILGNFGITIDNNKIVVIDLNGYKLNNFVNENKLSYVILNNGELTIKDSTANLSQGYGRGEIYNFVDEGVNTGEYHGTVPYRYNTNVITNKSTLIIESGKISQKYDTSMCFAIENSSETNNATLTVNGGLIEGQQTAIFMNCCSDTNVNNATIYNGKISALKPYERPDRDAEYEPWYYDSATSSIFVLLNGENITEARCLLNISGGIFESAGYAIYDYSFNSSYNNVNYQFTNGTFDGGIFSYGANIIINNGTFNYDVEIKQRLPSVISIRGGLFNGLLYNYGDNAIDEFILAGVFKDFDYEFNGETYNSIEDLNYLIPYEGYSLVDLGNGYWEVQGPPPINITLDLSTIGLPEGTHSIQMKLSGGDKRDSALSNAVTYVQYQQLTAPVINLSGDILTWSAVPNASSYKLYADNIDKGTVTSGIDLTTLQLAVGTHTIQVMAIGSGYYTDSDKSNSVSYTVQPSGGYDFANDSWATIFTQIKAGTDHYNLGDTKTDSVTISGTQYDGTYNVTFKIVDDKVGRYVTQSGQSHKVIEIQQIFGCNQDGGVVWNSSGSGTSFNASDIKNILNNTIINFLPSELRAVLETTTIYSGDGTQTASASTNVGATCKLFLASYNEYYGADASYGWANNTETNGKGQYTWYQQAGVTTSNYADMKKYQIEDTSTAYYYWTRSPYDLGALYGNAVLVFDDGSSSFVIVDFGEFRVAPCFAI